MTQIGIWAAVAAAVIGIAAAGADDDGHDRHGQGHGAHAHGVAELAIVVDGAVVEIELESPAMNLIGFEHRPRTAVQHEALDATVAVLRDGARLFSFEPSGARCVQKRTTVLSALLEDDDVHGHADEEHDDGDGHDHDDHADIFAAWRFECAGAALGGIDLRGLFSRFPGTVRLQVKAVAGQGQTARELTPASSSLRW